MQRELDVKDRKIMYHLDFNARMPLSQLAKKIGLSKQVTKLRLDHLQQKGIIQGFYTDINPAKIGYDIFLIYLKFQKLSLQKEKEFIAHLSGQEKVGVNASLQGKWDHTIGIWAENIYDFKDTYTKIMRDWEKYVYKKTLMIPTDWIYFKPRQIFQESEEKEIRMTGKRALYKLDKNDYIILTKIAKNARITLTDLSKITKLTPNAIKQRIKKLEKEKIILGYRLMINYTDLGFLHYRVFLHLENLTEEKEKKIIEFLKSSKTVISITKTMGYAELEFRSIVKDIHEFYFLMEKLRENFTEIKDYESFLHIKFHEGLNYFPISKS